MRVITLRVDKSWGGLLKYDLGRDVLLRFEKWTHFYTKFCWKMRPIFIPESQILSKIYLKFHIIFLFTQIVKLSRKFQKFWCQIDKIRPIFTPILEMFENMTHVYQFLHWIRGHRYTRRLILRPISAARPRVDLCTKNPPGHNINIPDEMPRTCSEVRECG